jgi:AcrR family transcriptional regulator
MSDSVKARRGYDSPRRRAQAAATRSEILTAAQSLFEHGGYAGTTVDAVAAEAGVAVKTVYLAFETKSGLLRALWNARLRGDEHDAPVGVQTWYREVLDESDPVRQLHLNARNARDVRSRVGALLDVVRGGALVDPEIAALWERIQAEFHANQRAIVQSIHRKKALKPGLGVDRATDILWTLNHPAVWHLLTHERGWTPRRYERWLAEASCSELLRTDPGR